MAFIKEESEDVKIEETFRVKHEDNEQQTGWFHSQSLSSPFCVMLLCYLSRDKMNITN